MDIFSAIFVVVPLILPVAAAFEIDPLHLGAIFLINLELGYLTPPVGMNLFLSSFRFNTPMPQRDPRRAAVHARPARGSAARHLHPVAERRLRPLVGAVM